MARELLAGLLVLQGALGIFTSIRYGWHSSALSYYLAIPATLMSALQVVMGIGLRARWPFVRWLSLGACACMIVGGVLVPILVLVATGYAAIIIAGLGHGHVPPWLRDAPFFAFITIALAIVAAFISYLGFLHLRSREGRMQFGAVEESPGVLSKEPVTVVIASIVVWLVLSWVSTKPIIVMADSLPRFLQTKQMRERADEKLAKARAAITSGARFTTDFSHLVIPPSELSPEVKILDLGTGRLTRVAAPNLPREQEFFRALSTDGSALVGLDHWVSLSTGEVHRVRSLVYGLIGFQSPARLLQYDSRGQKLELVDLSSDRKLYSLEVQQSRRGNDAEVRSVGWSDFSQAWSPDRMLYAWMNRDNTLSVLRTATGDVRELRCPYCRYGGTLMFLAGGDKIFVPDPVSHRSDDPGGSRGGVLDLGSEQWSSVSYRGEPQFVDARVERAAFARYEQKALDYREIGASGTRSWTLEVPEQFGPVRLSEDASVLSTYRAGEAGSVALYAACETPADRRRVGFVSLTPSSVDMRGGGLYPLSSFVVFTNGPKLEIIDIHAALLGRPASRTIDVLKDDTLSPLKEVILTPGLTGYWAESTSAEEPLTQDAQSLQDSNVAADIPVVGEVREPESTSPPGHGIVKCVDPRRGVTFTQGACPPGTTPGEAPQIASAPSRPYLPSIAPTSADDARPRDTLSALMKPDDKVDELKMFNVDCTGGAGRKGTYFLMAIRHSNGSRETIYAGGKQGRRGFRTATAALAASCAEGG